MSMRVELVSDFSSLLLVIASYFGNEIVLANHGVLRVVVASTFGCWFGVPIIIFNINTFRLLPFLYFYIITYIVVQPSGLVFRSDSHRLLLFILNMRVDQYMSCQFDCLKSG